MNLDNKIINGDCLEFMKFIPDNSIDLVVTDPPYGDNASYGRNKKEIMNNQDESINYKFLSLIYNKLKNNTSLYLFTNWKFEHKLRFWIENNTKFNIKMLLIIVKPNFGMGYSFRNQYEICLVLEKGKPKYNYNNFSNVYIADPIDHNKDSHPHEKPISLITKIIKHSSKEGDLVYDGFLGSGSLIQACIITKRKYLGCELDENWFSLINSRVNKWSKQRFLF